MRRLMRFLFGPQTGGWLFAKYLAWAAIGVGAGLAVFFTGGLAALVPAAIFGIPKAIVGMAAFGGVGAAAGLLFAKITTKLSSGWFTLSQAPGGSAAATSKPADGGEDDDAVRDEFRAGGATPAQTATAESARNPSDDPFTAGVVHGGGGGASHGDDAAATDDGDEGAPRPPVGDPAGSDPAHGGGMFGQQRSAEAAEANEADEEMDDAEPGRRSRGSSFSSNNSDE